MKPENYGSREACQKLVDAGIVVETETVWYKFPDTKWKLGRIGEEIGKYAKHIPAPSMAEVWGELPVYFEIDQCFQPNLVKVADDNEGVMYSAFYSRIDRHIPVPACYQKSNPTDTLIDLLIWVRKEKK